MKPDYSHSHSQEEEEEDQEAQCRREYIMLPTSDTPNINLPQTELHFENRIEKKKEKKKRINRIITIYCRLMFLHCFPFIEYFHQVMTNIRR